MVCQKMFLATSRQVICSLCGEGLDCWQMPCTVGSQSQTWFFRRLALVCTYSRTTSAIIRKGKPALSLSEVSLSPILRQHPLLRKGKQGNIELSTFAFSSLTFNFNSSRTTSSIKKRKTCLHRIEHFHFLNFNFHLFLENIHYQEKENRPT